MSTINSRFLYFLLCVTIITGCNRCKEECDDPTNPECPNYCPPVDPCEGINEVSADFIIEELVDINPITWRETEGVIGTTSSQTVRLTALQNGLNYVWIIGADTIYDQQYEFNFSSDYYGQNIPLKLIVSGSVDSICNPLDNGMDTLTRSIHVVELTENPIFGRYKVATIANPLDSFIVEICTHFELGGNQFYVHNFDNAGNEDSCRVELSAIGYKYLNVYTYLILPNCKRIIGDVWLDTNNQFHGIYQLDDDGDTPLNYIDYHVYGRKIN